MTLPITAEPPILTTDPPSQAKNLKPPTLPSPKPSKACNEVQREVVRALPVEDTRMVDEQKLLEERLQRLEQEISHGQASNPRSSAGRVDESLETHRGRTEENDEREKDNQ